MYVIRERESVRSIEISHDDPITTIIYYICIFILYVEPFRRVPEEP